MRAQQVKVFGFLLRHAEPVQVVLRRHAGKPPDGIERQIDGVEFNVRNGMHQRAVALGGER